MCIFSKGVGPDGFNGRILEYDRVLDAVTSYHSDIFNKRGHPRVPVRWKVGNPI
jgi:hypothetical protein